MAKGSVFPPEKSTYADRETGATVHRLTDYLGHSNHLYFTHWPFYAGQRRMLFHSDRENAHNLFGLDLESWEIRQLTGFQPGQDSPGPFSACVNPVRDEAYFWAGLSLRAIDLGDLSERAIWERPGRILAGTPNCTSDGAHLCFTVNQDLSDRLPWDPLRGYVGFAEYWEARPHCGIVRLSALGGDVETLWEEDYWLGHVNTSPTAPSIMTFCHEGPWTRVDHRIWGLDMDSKSAWRIRAGSEGDIVGHEYWFADGTRVGYHGGRSSMPFVGSADYRGGDFEDHALPRGSTHFSSLGRDLIVSDGGGGDPYLMLWRWNGEGYDGALLCRHRCSFHTQQLHVHPRFTPDGKGVIYTSDMKGYGDVYLVEVPEFESLPSVARDS